MDSKKMLAEFSRACDYQEIGNAVAEAPDATFLQVIDCLRRDYGYSRKEFLNRFRRVLTVFDREKRNEEKRAKTRTAFGLRQQADLMQL
jgi:hypothetical protein